MLEPSGKLVEQIDVGNGVVTNICFGGSDGRTLFTAELWPGRVRTAIGTRICWNVSWNTFAASWPSGSNRRTGQDVGPPTRNAASVPGP